MHTLRRDATKDNPWALEFLGEGQQLLRRDRQRVARNSAEGSDSEDAEELDILGEVGALYEAMGEAKEAVGEQESLMFQSRPLMGKWTLAHTGVVCDAYQARAVGDHAIQFCVEFGIQQPVRFSTQLYGQEGALTLCRYWCSKLSFFFKEWVDAGASGFPFDDNLLRSFHEPDAFGALVRAITAPVAQSRFAALRALRPSAPA